MRCSQKALLVLGEIDSVVWTAVVCPIANAHRVIITNTPASASDLSLSIADNNLPVVLIPPGYFYTIELSHYYTGYIAGEVICFLKGAGLAPQVMFTQ